MCPFTPPQCDSAERKLCVSACRIDTDSPAYLCISPVLEHAIYKQTKPPKKKHGPPPLFQGPTSHTQTHTHTLKCTGSHALWPLRCLIQVHPTQGDWLLQRILLSSTEKTRGTTFVVEVLSVTLFLPPKWATALSLSLFLFSPPPPVSIFTSERWAAERVHFQKQGKGSLSGCFLCVSWRNTFSFMMTVIEQGLAESDKTSLLLNKHWCDMRTGKGNNTKVQHYSFYSGFALHLFN